MAARSASQGNEPQAALRWCASIAPPAPLLAHFSAHHLTLGSAPGERAFAPTRLTTISHGAVRIVGKRAALDGRRIGVLHPEPGAADAFAQTLRARGAEVAVLSLDPTQLARAVALDPEVIVVEPRHVTAACWPALEAVFQHPQLRWTSVLVAAPEMVEGVEAHDWPGLCAQVQLLCAEYDAAAARARSGEQVDMELESIGPARVLRLLVQAGKSYRAVFSTSTLTVEVDVAEGLIVGARGAFGKVLDDALLGTSGLEALLNETSGLVRARPVLHPAVTNIMCPLDAALAAAGHGVRRVARSANTIISVRPRPSFVGEGTPSSVRTIRDRTLIGMPAPKLPAEALAFAPELAGTPSREGKRSSRPDASLSLPPPSLAARLSLAAKRSLPSITLPPKFSLASFALPSRASLPENENAARSEGDAAQAEHANAPASDSVDEPAQSDAPSPPVAQASAPEATEREEQPRPVRRGFSPSANEATLSMDLAPEPKPAWRLKGAIAVIGMLTLGLGAHALSRQFASKASTGSPEQANTNDAQHAVVKPGEPSAPDAPQLDERDKPAVDSKVGEESKVRAAASSDDGEVANAAQPLAPGQASPSPSAEPPATVEPRPAGAAELPAAAVPSSDVKPPVAKRVTAADNRRAIAIAKQATLLVRKGDSAKAKALYESALAVAPDNPRALWGRARIALTENDPANAVSYAHRLSVARPRSASSFLLLGEAQHAAGDEASARAAYERAAELGSPDARVRLRESAAQ